MENEYFRKKLPIINVKATGFFMLTKKRIAVPFNKIRIVANFCVIDLIASNFSWRDKIC